MALYLSINGLALPNNTVRVANRVVRAIEYNRFVVAHEHELRIEGYLYSIGPGNLSADMGLLELACKTPSPDIFFVSTDTGITAHALTTGGSIGGVVISNLEFPDTPLSMATQVKFTFTATAIYNNALLGRSVVSLTETIRIQGDGGPDDVLATQAGAPSIYQRLADYTDVYITQSGKIISRSASTTPPNPVITIAGAKVSRASSLQKSYRQFGTSILLYEQDYSYTFQLPVMPLGSINPTALE